MCRLSDGPINQLIYDDPKTGDPILYFGAYCQLAGNTLQPGLPKLEVPDDRINIGEFFYSYASLENVQKVRLFLDENGIKEDQLKADCCIGILLTYNSGNQEALGQCRIGLSTSIEILHPTTLHWKEVPLRDNVFGVNVRFSSKSSRLEAPNGVGWQSTEMAGVAEWWFNHIAVIISLKSSEG